MDRKRYLIRKREIGTFKPQLEYIPVTHFSNGATCEIPCLTLEGKGDGPTVGLIACIHGNEHTGVEVVRQVMTSLEPEQFRGRILAIPVANALAFDFVTRDTPLDNVNLNRVFPGDSTRTFTEQLACVIAEKFISRLDFLIDLHSGATFGDINYALVEEKKETGLAFGADNISVGASPLGGVRKAAEDMGVHAITAEVGGIDCGTDVASIERGVTGVINLMKHWGMMEGELELPSKQVVFTEKAIVRSRNGGLYYSTEEAKLNNVVPKGTVLGYIVHPHTFEIIEELKAPYDENVIFMVRTNCGIPPGDFVHFIGNGDKMEIVMNGSRDH